MSLIFPLELLCLSIHSVQTLSYSFFRCNKRNEMQKKNIRCQVRMENWIQLNVVSTLESRVPGWHEWKNDKLCFINKIMLIHKHIWNAFLRFANHWWWCSSQFVIHFLVSAKLSVDFNFPCISELTNLFIISCPIRSNSNWTVSKTYFSTSAIVYAPKRLAKVSR